MANSMKETGIADQCCKKKKKKSLQIGGAFKIKPINTVV